MLKFIFWLVFAIFSAIFFTSLFAGIAGFFLSLGVIKIVATVFAGILTAAVFIGCIVAFILAP